MSAGMSATLFSSGVITGIAYIRRRLGLAARIVTQTIARVLRIATTGPAIVQKVREAYHCPAASSTELIKHCEWAHARANRTQRCQDVNKM
jgi:hypothetical protein